MTDTPSGQATDAIRHADILIIGGGLSGAMLAAQLLRLPGKRQVLVIEPRAELGRGEAYSAVELGHTLNGNAARMSVDPDNADDLTQWLTEYITAGGWPESDQQHVPISELFAPRGLFGVYVQQRLAEAQAVGALNGSSVEHVRAEVVDLQTRDNAVLLILSDGQRLQGAYAVLATGMFPAARTPQTESSGLNAAALDPWDVTAMRQLDPQSTVLIIGSGLTMVDAVVSLEQAGHRGPIEVFSRHGLLPHVRRQPPAWADFFGRGSQHPHTASVDARTAPALPRRHRPGHRLASAARHRAGAHRAVVEPGDGCAASAVCATCAAVVGKPSPSLAAVECRVGGAAAWGRAVADSGCIVQRVGAFVERGGQHSHSSSGRGANLRGAWRGADQLQWHRI